MLISNIVGVTGSVYFYNKAQNNESINDDIQRDLALELRKVRSEYETMSIAFDKNLKLYQDLGRSCVDHETYGYALSYAASLEIGVRDIDAYSYLESFDRGAILEARDIAAENFKFRPYENDVNPGEDQCYTLRHLDVMVCKDIKSNKCVHWVGGDFNTPDYNCDLFNFYKRESKKYER